MVLKSPGGLRSPGGVRYRAHCGANNLFDCMQSHIGCICLTFLHCVFSYVSPKNVILDGCSTVSYKWDGMDWVGWSPGGVRYRAPYGANNYASHLNCIHILESIAVSLHVHAKGWKRLEERGSRQGKVRRRNWDPGQGGHHTILMRVS